VNCNGMTLKCKGYQDVLVIVDKLLKWVEVFTTKKGSAVFMVKVLRHHLQKEMSHTIVSKGVGISFNFEISGEMPGS